MASPPGAGPKDGQDTGQFSAPMPGKSHVLYKIGDATNNSYNLHLLLKPLEELNNDDLFKEEVSPYASQVAQRKRMQMPQTASLR